MTTTKKSFVHSGMSDFEYSFEEDTKSKDYKMELWILIAKASYKMLRDRALIYTSGVRLFI